MQGGECVSSDTTKNKDSHMGVGVLAHISFGYLSLIGGACARRPRPLADSSIGELSDDGLQPARSGVHLDCGVCDLRRHSFVARISMFPSIPSFAQDPPDTSECLRRRMGPHHPLCLC